MSSFDSECSSTEITEVIGQDVIDKLIASISSTLTRLLEQNKKLPDYQKAVKSQSKMPFSSREIPNISLSDYLSRISYYSKPEESTLILSLIYIDKMCQMGSIMLSEYNIHRILFSSILTSIKYNEDQYYDINYYAEVAGVSPKELLLIEEEFLDEIDFTLFVGEDEYKKYYEYLTEQKKE